MAYPTTAELVAASAVEELTGLTVPQQAGLRDLAIVAVEAYTGQKFEPLVGTIRVDGPGGRELYLPRRVEAISGITAGGTDLDLSEVELSDDGDRLSWAPLVTDYATRAMREDGYADSRTFRRGANAVRITGTFGWSVVPAAVVQAIRLDMEDQALADASGLAGPVASARRLGLRDVSQGNLRMSLGGHAGGVSGRVQRLLSRYVWHGAAGHMV